MRAGRGKHSAQVIVAAWVGAIVNASWAGEASTSRANAEPVAFEIKTETILKDFDGRSHWFDPRAGIVPAGAWGGGMQIILMQRAFMSASDYFSGYSVMTSRDNGVTWSDPRELIGLGWREEAGGV